MKKFHPVPPPHIEDDFNQYCEWATQHQEKRFVISAESWYKAIIAGLLILMSVGIYVNF